MSAETGARPDRRAQRKASPDTTVVVPISITEKRAEATARAILRDISQDHVAPGTALPPEAAMLAHYGVARGTLREALRILEFNGLVSVRRGPSGGPVVAEPTPAELGRVATLHFEAMGVRYQDLTSARGHLEPLMARLAAGCTDDGLLARLEDVLETTSNATNRAAYLTATTDFHECVVAMSGNPVLSHLAGSLIGIGHRFNERPTPATRTQVRADHLAIGKAILAGDGFTAERLMVEHWGRTLVYGAVPTSALQRRIEWT